MKFYLPLIGLLFYSTSVEGQDRTPTVALVKQLKVEKLVSWLDISADGQTLCAYNDNNNGTIISLGGGAERKVILGAGRNGYFLSNGEFTAGQDDYTRTVKVVKLVDHKVVWSSRGVHLCANASTGFIAWTNDQTISFLKPIDAKAAIKELILDKESMFNPAVRSIASNGLAIICNSVDGKCVIWAPDKDASFEIDTGARSNCACFSKNNLNVAIATADRALQIWDLKEKKIRKMVGREVLQNQILELAYIHGLKFIVSISFSGEICLWDSENLKLLHCLVAHPEGARHLVAFPDREQFVSVDAVGLMKIWRIEHSE